MRNRPTFEVLCRENNRAESIVGDEGSYLRRDLVALPAHHKALSDSSIKMLARVF